MDREEAVRLKRREMKDLDKIALRLGLSKSDVVRRSLAFTLPVFANVKLPPVKVVRDGNARGQSLEEQLSAGLRRSRRTDTLAAIMREALRLKGLEQFQLVKHVTTVIQGRKAKCGAPCNSWHNMQRRVRGKPGLPDETPATFPLQIKGVCA